MASRQKNAPQKSEFELELERRNEERRVQEEQKKRKESLENKRNTLNGKLREAIDKYIEYSQKYGEEDMRTQFQLVTVNLLQPLAMFVEVVLNMQETLEVLDQTMSIVDQSMGIIDGILDTHNHPQVGLFGRMRTNMRMKRFMGAWKSRMKQIEGVMSSMSGGMKIITKEMTAMMATFSGGGKKNKNQPASGGGLDGNAKRMVEERKRELGIDTTEGSGDTSGSAGGTSGAPAGSADGGPGGLDGLV